MSPTAASLLDHLTDEQQAAVLAPTDRPVLVNAGAGSGKTTVLTVRASHLIKTLGYKPSSLLLTTFTKNASIEMVARIKALVGAEAERIWAGTIHSVALRIVRQEFQSSVVFAGSEQSITLRQSVEAAFEAMRLDPRDRKYIGPRYWEQWIEWAKTSGLAPGSDATTEAIFTRMEASRPGYPTNYLLAEIADDVYRRYEQTKGRALDFADMLVQCRDLLRKPKVAARYQAAISYVLVDECQDSSAIQNEILTILSQSKHLLTVGDDSQSLFMFRAATPHENIYNFLKRFPDGVVYPITMNFRSTPQVLEVANRVIATNYGESNKQYAKTLLPRPGDWSKAVPVRFQQYETDADEAVAVATEVEREVKVGLRRARDYFVLFRVNAQSQLLEAELVTRGIKVICKTGSFFNRKIVQDCLAYSRLAFNRHDATALLRVYDVPSPKWPKTTRYLGRKFVAELQDVGAKSLWEAMERLYPTQPYRRQQAIQDIMDYTQSLEDEAQDTLPSELLATIAGDYKDYLHRREGDTVDDDEVLDQLVTIAGRFDTWAKFNTFIEIMQSTVKEENGDSDAVVLSTVHGAKGLERPVVYAVGLSEGVFPHWLSTGDAVTFETQEGKLVQRVRADTAPAVYDGTVGDERCAAFVNLTRAKEELRVSAATRIGTKVGLEVSRFVKEAGLAGSVEGGEL